jgi:peptidoglycan/xylan/chitin deacetylase (PgdA/CDA1 family)
LTLPLAPLAPRVYYCPEVIGSAPRSPRRANPYFEQPEGPRQHRSCPIFSYGPIAVGGAILGTKRGVTLAELEAQLELLVAKGLATISLAHWVATATMRLPLVQRVCHLSFTASPDFSVAAWPLLKKYGFSASLFVPADPGEGAASQATAPEISSHELEQLRSDGVEFGVAFLESIPLTALDFETLAETLVRCRLGLERRLNQPVAALAYPFGQSDDLVGHVAGTCGFLCGLTQDGRAAQLGDDPLLLPSFAVFGGRCWEGFEATLEIG